MKRIPPLASREYRRFETLHKRFNIFFHRFVNSPKTSRSGFPSRDGFSTFHSKISSFEYGTQFSELSLI